jgi:hypothetical protein
MTLDSRFRGNDDQIRRETPPTAVGRHPAGEEDWDSSEWLTI